MLSAAPGPWHGSKPAMDHRRIRSHVRPTARRVASLIPIAAIVAVAALWAPSGVSAARTASPPTPTVAVTPGMTTLPGSLHPKARPELDIGHMDPGAHLSGMSLLFRMSPVQKAFEKRALAAVQDPASPSYHKWFTPEQYAAEFGASSADVARATAWLTAQGLSVDGPSRTATRLGFSGTIAQIEKAFRTEMHRYRVEGANHFAMSRAPSVPAELGDLVLGLHGLHDFHARAARPLYAEPITNPDGGSGSFPILSPADFAKIYDAEALYAAHITGAGQSIAIAGASDFTDADVMAFRSTFGLPASAPMRILVPNTGSPAVTSGEPEIDIEWSGAVAPGATIKLVYTGTGPNSDVLDALNYAIEQRAAPVVSISYGNACESELSATDAVLEEQYGDAAALEGMTVVASAGDAGAAGCDGSVVAAQLGEFLLLPASIPSVVAVGGSQLQLAPSNQSTYLDTSLDALSYIPESAWNETLDDIDAGYGGLGAGGGGVSRLYAKPYWQVPYTPNDGFRDVPDVVLSASAETLPYAVIMSSGGGSPALTDYGGTSVSAPAFAGILALVNQAIAEANPGDPVGLGNANPMLYALANNAASKNAFHDITTGDNIVPCVQGSADCPSSPPYQIGYTAGPGYDQATGLGSIDAANLVAAWKALTPTSTALTVSIAGAAEGSPMHLTATVASKAAVNSMAGTVTFYFEAASDGGVRLSGTLGVATLASSISSGTESGTASLTANAPGGLQGGGVRISAFYGGDSHYLSSWSPASPVSATSTLAICPTAVTLEAGQSGFTFTTTGGRPPIQWGTERDKTRFYQSQQILRSTIEAGVFTAGPQPGTVTVVAIDQDLSYATAEVTVVANQDGAAPYVSTPSCPLDGGSDAAVSGPGTDASVGGSNVDAPGEAATADASANAADAIEKGCGCVVGGKHAPEAAGGWLGGLLLLTAFARRRFKARVGRYCSRHDLL